MAYSRRSRAGTRSYSKRAPARRAPARSGGRRSGSRSAGQTIRIVVETPAAGAVARPGAFTQVPRTGKGRSRL